MATAPICGSALSPVPGGYQEAGPCSRRKVGYERPGSKAASAGPDSLPWRCSLCRRRIGIPDAGAILPAASGLLRAAPAGHLCALSRLSATPALCRRHPRAFPWSGTVGGAVIGAILGNADHGAAIGAAVGGVAGAKDRHRPILWR